MYIRDRKFFVLQPNRRWKMPEQWPESYLKAFWPFVANPRSERYALALLDKHLAELPSFHSAWHVLDVCCGRGMMGQSVAAHLASKGKMVETIFLDKSPAILAGVKLEPKDHSLCADVTAMNKVGSESQDIVVCRYGFNNLPREDWLKALGEVLRVLKPGGVFLLQDHFVPGSTFSALINEAEQFLARMERKQAAPFIFSTEAFNAILDEHPLVASRIKAGYGLFINIWERLRAKSELLPDFEAAKAEIMRLYSEVCLGRYGVLIVDPDEYIHVFNITYAIVKRSARPS